MKKIRVKNLYTGGAYAQDQTVLFSDKIEAVRPSSEAGGIDAQDLGQVEIMVPGFIDLHIHGGGGADVMDGRPEALATICHNLPKSGCTSFLATTMTQAQPIIEQALANVRRYMADQAKSDRDPAAQILGVHLEGPFISPKKCGAQDPTYILEPRPDTTAFLQPYLDLIRIITVAPEQDRDYTMIKAWTQAGIVCSMGHTACTYAQAEGAFAAGLSHVTHCFNAMSPLHHREPGAVGAALTLPLSTEMVVDGEHLHPQVVKLICQIKPPELRVLITDAMRAAGLGNCESELGGQKVFVQDGKATLENGVIAGSVLDLATALRNTQKFTGLDLVEIIRMLTANPARIIGVDQTKGWLKPGYDADFVLLNQDLGIDQTWIGGRLAYRV